MSLYSFALNQSPSELSNRRSPYHTQVLLLPQVQCTYFVDRFLSSVCDILCIIVVATINLSSLTATTISSSYWSECSPIYSDCVTGHWKMMRRSGTILYTYRGTAQWDDRCRSIRYILMQWDRAKLNILTTAYFRTTIQIIITECSRRWCSVSINIPFAVTTNKNFAYICLKKLLLGTLFYTDIL